MSIINYASILLKQLPFDDINFINDFKQSMHSKLLKEVKNNIHGLVNLGDFRKISLVNGMQSKPALYRSIQDMSKIVKLKLKRKEISSKTYGKVMDWWKNYTNGLDNLSDFPILLYNSNFDDKLFEIWIVEQIKNSLINDFGFVYSKSNNGFNPLWHRKKLPIYSLEINNGQYEKGIDIYFQKSTELMWDNQNDPNWELIDITNTKHQGFLRGNLDIIVKCRDDLFDPVIIDAKNIDYRLTSERNSINPNVTDKVYKMVGYHDNFKKKLRKNNNALGLLVFKNDNLTIEHERKYINLERNAEVSIFSIDLSSEKLNFKTLSSYILRHFEINGE